MVAAQTNIGARLRIRAFDEAKNKTWHSKDRPPKAGFRCQCNLNSADAFKNLISGSGFRVYPRMCRSGLVERFGDTARIGLGDLEQGCSREP